MSQALQKQVDSSTSNRGIEFSFVVDVDLESTEITQSEIQEITLDLPENESLDEYKKEMDSITDLCLEEYHNEFNSVMKSSED